MIRLMILLMLSWPSDAKNFSIYWNGPSIECEKYGISFKRVFESLGLIQNTDDAYMGDKIVILNNPGQFPQNDDSTVIVDKNNINYEKHLRTFRKSLQENIPNKEFSGLAVIRLTEWQPMFTNISGSLQEQSSSEKNKMIAQEAFARKTAQFMLKALAVAKHERYRARWSYWGCPICNNFSERNSKMSCSNDSRAANDRLTAMWKMQNVLTPSIETPETLSLKDAHDYITGRINETKRIAESHHPDVKIIPYMDFMNGNNEDINENIAAMAARLNHVIRLGVDGLIIGGRFEHFKSLHQCKAFNIHVRSYLGVALRHVLGTDVKPKSPEPIAMNESGEEIDSVLVPEDKNGNTYNSQMNALPFHIIIFSLCLYFTRILVTN